MEKARPEACTHIDAPRVFIGSNAAGRIGIALLLVLSGCASIVRSFQNQECRLDPDRPYDVVTVDPDRHDIRLLWRDASGRPFGTLDAARDTLEAGGDSVVALTNGGIYEPGLVPTGLYIEDGDELHPLNLSEGEGNFYLKPNGVFFVDARGAGIAEASKFDGGSDVLYATQSGPLLLEDGDVHSAFNEDSQNCRLRSGVGVEPNGTVYLAISNGAVNFHDFATFFRDKLGATDALYLDGAISELYAPSLGRLESGGESFAVILAVTVKPR